MNALQRVLVLVMIFFIRLQVSFFGKKGRVIRSNYSQYQELATLVNSMEEDTSLYGCITCHEGNLVRLHQVGCGKRFGWTGLTSEGIVTVGHGNYQYIDRELSQFIDEFNPKSVMELKYLLVGLKPYFYSFDS